MQSHNKKSMCVVTTTHHTFHETFDETINFIMASSIVSYICGSMLLIQRMSDEKYFCRTLLFNKIVLSSKYGNYEKNVIK